MISKKKKWGVDPKVIQDIY